MKRLSLGLFIPLSLTVLACGPQVGVEEDGTTTDAEPSTGEEMPPPGSSTETGPPGTSSTSAPPPDDSSSTDPGTESSGGVPSVCGDGVIEGLEACDDGNDADEDGCNSDCVESGTLLWSWDAPDEQRVARIDYGPDDALLVATVRTDGVPILTRFDARGVLQRGEALDPVTPPPGATDPGTLDSLDVEVTATATYVSDHRYWMIDGEYVLRSRIQRVGGWSVELPREVFLIAERSEGGVAVIGRTENQLIAFDDAGEEAWVFDVQFRPLDVRTLPGGLVVTGADGAVLVDDGGTEVWRTLDEVNDGRNFSHGPVSDAFVLLRGSVTPPNGFDDVLLRYDLGGALLEEVVQPDGIGYPVDTTPSGFIVWSLSDDAAAAPEFLQKVRTDLSVVWSQELGTQSPQQIDTDSRGSVAVVVGNRVSVYAP